MNRASTWAQLVLAMGALAASSSGVAQWAVPPGWNCGSFTREGRLEPEDYRRASKRLKTVETYHFGPNVEELIRPMQRGMTFGADLDYTLWGYPNHHRALITLVKLAAKEKTEKPAGSEFTVDCYFARAFVIANDDVVTRMIYASYLGAQKRIPQAMANMKLVVEQAGDNPMTHLNAGLIYLELGAMEEAQAQAQRVSELGFPNDRLVEEIQRRTKAKGAAPKPIPAASAAIAASASTAAAPSPPAAEASASPAKDRPTPP